VARSSASNPLPYITDAELTEVLRHLEVSESSWARWRAQYGDLKADEAKRLKEVERENARLKKLLAEAELERAMLKELVRETSDPGASPASGMSLAGRLRFPNGSRAGSRGSTGRRNADRVRHSRSTMATCAPSCVGG